MRKTFSMNRTYCFVMATLVFCACNSVPDEVALSLNEAGRNRIELEEVIAHYQESNDKLKLKAAYYLIANMRGQYHYVGEGVEVYQKQFSIMDSIISSETVVDYNQTWKTLQPNTRMPLRKVRDIQVIKADFLISNIEEAFEAWNYPWAKSLSFEEFREHLLPYKLKNEAPENWRKYFQDKYKWVVDSMKDKTDPQEACKLINNDMSKWFYIINLNCPFDLSFNDLLKTRAGRCPQSTQMATYAMRAMGIPVTLDFVPLWANRNSGHDWNALILNNQSIPFLGTEIDPGLYKLDFVMPGSFKSKKAKVYRRSFAPTSGNLLDQNKDISDIPPHFRTNRLLDVTQDYIPVSDVTFEIDPSFSEFKRAFLCVFNNLKWEPIHWGAIVNNSVTFTDMGMDIVYLPAVYLDGEIIPIDSPFLLNKDGSMTPIEPSVSKLINITIDRKYPVADDNKIFPGSNYELLYWNGTWHSLGKQVATDKLLTYNDVPEDALLWLRNLDEGKQERIFTIQKGKPVWW